MSKILRLSGLIGALLLWAAVVLGGWLTPGYSHSRDAISELGAIGAPYPWVVNWVGIIPFGLAVGFTAVFVIRDLPRGVGVWLAALLLLVGGLGFSLAGLMQCDIGCGASDLPSAALHGLGAGLGFLLIPLASFVIGLRVFRPSAHRRLYLFSLLMGLAMVLSLALFAGRLDPGRELLGLWQRLLVLSITVWIGGLSLYLARSADREPASAVAGRSVQRAMSSNPDG